MQFKRIKRAVSGVLLLDKAYGISSNAALQQVKRLFQAEKAGHTGSLDPIATGLLPVCFGEATKFSHYLLDASKGYQARFKLGTTTTTGDIEGEILTQLPVTVSLDEIHRVLKKFVGPIQQIPPMYSALKHQGKALYTYARAGVDIHRNPREVTIYDLTLDVFSGDELNVTVHCSKGTYIRVLGEDIGAALGCGAHMVALRRIETGRFHLRNAINLSQLEEMTPEQRDATLLPVDCLLASLPKVILDSESAFYLQQGQSVRQAGQSEAGPVGLYGPGAVFLGLGEITDQGKIAPKRLVLAEKT
ncbi:MAG: tRNA pseudouridine(55) synthase TruB [Sulfurimicrobium sp.]|nr:tRNA pseudouridine(55) synthase TruB [Sulfurimicrobium sp.]MDP1703867.1 tRNA pseudouridine(55) synthase TruB [Sulfurimicrobium sp.]MDP2197913.1 tRNA pseudouridine(55) synthase TruB [Sulfurimicrobium sp.]